MYCGPEGWLPFPPRIPDEVWRAAITRAKTEGSSVTAEVVAFLRAYGSAAKRTTQDQESNKAGFRPVSVPRMSRELRARPRDNDLRPGRGWRRASEAPESRGLSLAEISHYPPSAAPAVFNTAGV